MPNKNLSPYYEIHEIISTHKEEVSSYLEFIQFTFKALSAKGGRLIDGDGIPYKVDSDLITTLYSTSYLLFYNSIESVMTKIVDFLSKKINSENKKITDFKIEIQKQWIKGILKLNDQNITTDNRIIKALDIVNHFSKDASLSVIIDKNSSNFDESIIYRIFKDIGAPVKLSRELNNALHKGYENKDGSCLKHIKKQRNYLSHGHISFKEGGRNITIEDLNKMSEIVFKYLEELEDHFKAYIDEKRYLLNV